MSNISLDPTVIQLEEGETKEIITDDQAQRGIPYLIQIEGKNPVRYAHQKQDAKRGIQLSGQQTHTISNFRGSGVYVEATDGPTALRVRPAGADIESQPEKTVRVVGDVTVGSNIDITDDSNRQLGIVDVTDDSSRQLGIVDLGNTASVDIDSLPTPIDVSVNDPLATESTVSSVDTTLANVEDSLSNNSGVETFTVNVSNINQQLPSYNCPPGSTLSLKADQNNSDVIFIENDFPLAPGEGVSVNVTNSDTISVTPSTGTQTIYGIVETQ